jgi:hypothetical protein
MVIGFFDESTHMDFVCMSGYIAGDDYWGTLTQEWNWLLYEKYKIPYLHLADFIAARGVYEELGWKEPRKNCPIDGALDDFISVIRRHTIAGVGVGVDASAYRKILKDVKKREKPEIFCFERVLRLAIDWLDSIDMRDPIVMVFDDPRDYAMKAYANLWEIKDRNPEVKRRIAGIMFGNDKYFPPLQAADMLAYASTRLIHLGENAWNEHPQFKNLLIDENPAYGKVYMSEKWTAQEIEQRAAEFRQIGNCGNVEKSKEVGK